MERKYDTGYKFTTNDGEDCEVVGRNGTKVLVKFLRDGWETECFSPAVKHRNLVHKGHIIHPKTGDIFHSNNCGKFEVIQKTGKTKYIVRFISTGHEKEVHVSNIRSGHIKDPYHPWLFSVGYLGGEIQDKRSYTKWRGMLDRCYNIDSQRYSTYGAAGVRVCYNWHNYQSFHEWWLKNVGEHPEWHIDKDLKSPDVKLYSPETCIMVPPALNSAMSNYTKPRIIELKSGYRLVHGRDKQVIKSCSLGVLLDEWGNLMYNRLVEISMKNGFIPQDLESMISDYVGRKLTEIKTFYREN